jgi:ATP-dependent RNA helicase DeaD
MGFAEDVETILADTPATKQVALFSATMPKQIRHLATAYLNDPEEVQVKSATKTNANITQRYLMCSYPQKVDALTRILEVENFEAMIVFTRTKSETDTLAEKLRARGFSAAAINGDVAQQQREKTVNQLKDGSLDILVATDVAARGLDVERISHVVNYDLPTDLEAYVHRIGRTGRAGRKGDAISFVTPRERWLLKAIEKHTKAAPVEMKLPSVDEVNATRLSRFDDGITAALTDEKVGLFRDIVAHYVREHDVPELDVAAALAVVLNGSEPLLLEEQPEPVRRERPVRDGDTRGERPQRGDRFERGDRPGRDAQPNRSSGQPMQQYRIEVGKRHRVEPRQVVGALANEGGLRRQDFGNITIKEHFTIVELPKDLAPEIWEALGQTRISGKLIELSVDNGPAFGGGRGGDRRPRREFADKRDFGGGDKPRRKPRY